MAESAPRDRVVSVRLTDEESAYLEQLTDVHVTDRSSMIRHLILSAPLWRLTEIKPQAPDRPECTCELIDASTHGGPAYVRGLSRGCAVHPPTQYEREHLEAQRIREAAREAADAEAGRKAREA
jgi:hypothetical protein